jgi:hypothetical protein
LKTIALEDPESLLVGGNFCLGSQARLTNACFARNKERLSQLALGLGNGLMKGMEGRCATNQNWANNRFNQ